METLSKEERQKTPDFEAMGYGLMRQIQNFEAVREICALHIHSYADKINSEIAPITAASEDAGTKVASLCSYLYDREDPVDDPAMLRHQILVAILGAVFGLTFLASISAHTFGLLSIYGLNLALAFLAGLGLSGLVTAVGYKIFDVIHEHRALEWPLVLIATILVFWGALQLAQSRSIAAVASESETSQNTSYVDDEQPANAASGTETTHSSERDIRTLQSNGITKIFFGADLIVGILLGELVRVRSNRDYVAWKEVKALKNYQAKLDAERVLLMMLIEIAKKKCMAGILRAMHEPRPRRPRPYHQVLPLLAFALIWVPVHVWAQHASRQEAILIDVSGSIADGGSGNQLFREYLSGVRQLLLSEPPDSRVVVLVISTDSFGGARELVKGWTPEAHGVFTDDLVRARRQLASSFEKKAADLTPMASGTDIFGALWRVDTFLDRGSMKDQSEDVRELWIFSDMVNETRALPMPSLLAAGTEGALAQARQNGLVVPLRGYKVHIVGASTRGLTPLSWNGVKAFWSEYFSEAGGVVVDYVADVPIKPR